jgi:hypothetical protein
LIRPAQQLAALDNQKLPAHHHQMHRQPVASELARKHKDTMIIPDNGRDSRGRFAQGNTIASAGGHARAAKLSKRKRRAIATKARRAMVDRSFHGDDAAQRRYLAQLGRYAYELMAGSYRPGSPLRTSARHPGPIQDWLAVYWTPSLFDRLNQDLELMPLRSAQPAGQSSISN